MHHVILGAGPAGVIAAETLRKAAPADTITLVGGEAEAPYSRMAIPYLIAGNVAESGTHLRHGSDHFKQLRIDQIQAKALRIEPADHRVVLDNGQTLTYDRLLIATGSNPVRLSVPGGDSEGVFNCWTLADARAIMERVQPGVRVVQTGAGFIGAIIMESLRLRGAKMTMVAKGDRMVPRMMGEVAGGMILDWCRAQGVDVITEAVFERIEPAQAGQPMKVHLSNGQAIEADVIISSTGVRPSIAFLDGSGVATKSGVLTDSRMRTNVEDIFAAGDCAEAFDKASGKPVVSAIQPNAADQARVAALNMAGQPAELKSVPTLNVLDTMGLISASFGHWQGVPAEQGGAHADLTDQTGLRHLNLQFRDDVLIGANAINWTEHVGVLRGLIDGKVKLGAWKDRLQDDPTQLMPAYLACAQALGQWNGPGDERRR